MLNLQKNKFRITQNLLLIIINIIIIKSQIEIPLKLIKTKYQKYPMPKEISIAKNTLFPFKSKLSYNLRQLKETLNIKLEILYSFLFACEIKIGTNNQTFNVILDTGSQILWVPEINNENGEIELIHKYSPSNSFTSENTNIPFSVEYATGYTQGYFYHDTIYFLSPEKYFIVFGSANKTVFNVEGADGIMGLARTYPTEILSPLLTLKKLKKISSTSFSFKYNEETDELFFYVGKIHSDFSKSNVAQCNLITNTEFEKILWFCHLDSFGFLNEEQKKEINIRADVNVLFDTGTNTCLLPYEILETMEKYLNKFNCIKGSSDSSFGDESYYVICLDFFNLPDIILQFGDYKLILDKYYMFFSVKINGGHGFYLNVNFMKNLEVAIIGQTFFIQFHTLFDIDNNALKFYSDYENQIKILNKNKGGDNRFAIIVVGALILGFIIYYCYRNKQIQNNEAKFEWMNYNLAEENNKDNKNELGRNNKNIEMKNF